MAEIKKRYSDEDLEEFRQIIEEKLEVARRDYKQMMSVLRNDDGNDVADTSPTYKILEEGSITQTKEEMMMFAAVRRSSSVVLRLHSCASRIRHTVLTVSQVS